MPLSGTPNISFSFCWIKWFMTIINQFIRPIDQVNDCFAAISDIPIFLLEICALVMELQ
jgi:hypothetical protein